ncbi:hypothetical protein [Mesorhizobium sp. INR15]|uniref:hypothetical protein n=1 Tax=Mesorhizobium sp. INR15 TaxID=2654248 RepID=UPI0018968799|nr:hypothetical protein [Mesorhizobium sp. INR15]QPC95461.1 hypothetical protein GA829_33175 [Mesorhizobium sp. INR15]
MDVSIKVSLQGGHSWEFVCDEDDPMVFGLVSALPGASLDSALPPDGLIQIESRSGERMFLTRSSLVAVTIGKRGAGGSTTVGLPPAQGNGTSPAMLPEVFDTNSIEALFGAVDASPQAGPATEAALEIELDALPAVVTAKLVEAIGRLTGGTTEDGQDTHLDVHLYRKGRGMLDPALGDERDLSGFLLFLDEANGAPPAAVVLVEHTGDGGVPLAANCALIFAPGAAPRLTVQDGRVLVLRAWLRAGAIDGPT